MKGRPDGLPSHISEENIGMLWQSVCSGCDEVQNLNQVNIGADEVEAKMKKFRQIHDECCE